MLDAMHLNEIPDLAEIQKVNDGKIPPEPVICRNCDFHANGKMLREEDMHAGSTDIHVNS
jgi:hypothetical protein